MAAANANMADTMQKVMNNHRDLLGAYICSAVAAIIMSYVVNVTKPDAVHVVLALIAVGAIVAAYLMVAGSKVAEQVKGATICGAAIVAALCFAAVSALM